VIDKSEQKEALRRNAPEVLSGRSDSAASLSPQIGLCCGQSTQVLGVLTASQVLRRRGATELRYGSSRHYGLAIVVAVLAAQDVFGIEQLRRTVLLGELGLEALRT
jgi:hypothetical protein